MTILPPHSSPLLALLAGSLAILGCGSESTETSPGESQPREIQITAASSKDENVATDLVRYIAPCPRVPRLEDLNLERSDERRIVRRYGSVENFLEGDYWLALKRVCQSYERVAVKEGVITVSTNLAAGEQGQRDADNVCNEIQGSDVADFETHTILDRDGELLFTCRGAGP
jgi:hypothetical protein